MVLGQYYIEELLYSIENKELTPFIGSGVNELWFPSNFKIAQEWAEKYDYPLKDSYDLARVAQFIEIEIGDGMRAKEILSQRLKKTTSPDFSNEEYKNTPHAVLADLNLPIYITTNYDNFMEEALRSRGKKRPVSEFCRWNNSLRKFAMSAGIPSVFDRRGTYKPTQDEPLVYHLFGSIDVPRSMVLSERDYLDFQRYLLSESERDFLPAVVRRALLARSLLCVGYNFDDSNFRNILQSILNFIESPYQLPGVLVLMPSAFIKEERVEMALRYMEQYIKYMFRMNVVWSEPFDFAAWLREPKKAIPSVNLKKIGLGNIQTDIDFMSILKKTRTTDIDFMSILKKHYRNSHAIIIGISSYKEENNLPNAIKDASAIMNILVRRYGFNNNNITSLLNEEATAENIRGILMDRLRDQEEIKSDDRVLMYYAGHGKVRSEPNYEGELRQEGYIVPYDSEKGTFRRCIEMKAIIDSCQRCIAKHVFLILDCCYAGLALTRSNGDTKIDKLTPDILERITQRRALQVLAAGQEDQTAADSGQNPDHSVFTGILLDILESGSDLDDNGILTASEIGTNVVRRVIEETIDAPQDPISTHLSGSGFGDFVFKIFNLE